MSDHRTPSSDPKALFSEAAVGALREALRHRVGDGPHDGELPKALRQVSSEAQAKGLHSEDVIILLKQVWSDLPGTASLAPSDRRRRLEELVTHCLDEYYSSE